ncbi:MAG TPA: VWA domain-containing protein [Gaiellaceae bacterium]|nr:VWA domain-containing protein [Gaiellaceae bacterium]
MSSVSFQSPWMLLGLLVLAAFVGLWLWAERRRAKYTVRYTNLDVLATVVSGRSRLQYVPAVLLTLGLGILVIGLARPNVERMVLKEKATVILVVDTSRSMQAEDVAPTRLGAAQEALRTFLDEAPDDLRVGLVVFAGEAQVATPPTDDHELVEAAITDIDEFLVFGGTAIGDALQTAVLLGRQVTDLVPEEGSTAAPAPSAATRSLAQSSDPPEGESEKEKSPVSILFLSDGAQTRGLLQPLEGARLAKEAGFPVYTIALGTPEGVIERGAFGGIPGQDSSQLIPVPPDPATLRAIAERTGGEFSEARTADALTKAYDNLGSRLGREEGESEVTWMFLALAAVLLLLTGTLAAVVSPRFP